MQKGITTIAAAAVLLFTATAVHADEAQCIAARYKAAGKYASCDANAFAKAVVAGGLNPLLAKCNQKYAATWTRLSAKYPGTSCEGARFVDNSDGTITDNLTLLVWEKKDASDGAADLSNAHDVDNRYTWSAVGSDADGAAFTDFLARLNSPTCFAAECDWRLPMVSELQTILLPETYPCATDPCIDPIFGPTFSYSYWSSSTYQVDPSRAWYVGFTVAAGGGADFKTVVANVRAVRAGS